jgi:hypothetical protein
MSSNPQDMEPKGGDYVRLINELQGASPGTETGRAQALRTESAARQPAAQLSPVLIKAMALILAGALCSLLALAYEADKLLPAGALLLFAGFRLIARQSRNSAQSRDRKEHRRAA